MNKGPRERLQEILLHEDKIELREKELLAIVPELIVCKNCAQNHPAHRAPVLAHTYEVVNGVDKDLSLKLAALLHDIGKPYVKKIVEGIADFGGYEKISEVLAYLILQRLGFKSDVRKAVILLIKHHNFELFPRKESIEGITKKIGPELVEPLLELQWSDLHAHSEEKIQEQFVIREATIAYYLNAFKK